MGIGFRWGGNRASLLYTKRFEFIRKRWFVRCHSVPMQGDYNQVTFKIESARHFHDGLDVLWSVNSSGAKRREK
jgi:hypothetical protein